MSIEEVMPEFSLKEARRNFQAARRWYYNNIVSRAKIMNPEVIENITPDMRVLYLLNHQTFLDYFSFNALTLENENLPYPRMITGKNLDNPLLRDKMFEFGKWGVIWYDKDDTTGQADKDLRGAGKRVFAEGGSLGGFPEGKRNRNIGGLPDVYYKGLPIIGLEAQREIGKENPIYVVCAAQDHDHIPEDGFFGEIDGTGPEGYFEADARAFTAWKKRKDKGEVRFAFSEPVPILELVGEGSRKGERLAQMTREITAKNLLKIRSGYYDSKEHLVYTVA